MDYISGLPLQSMALFGVLNRIKIMETASPINLTACSTECGVVACNLVAVVLAVNASVRFVRIGEESHFS